MAHERYRPLLPLALALAASGIGPWITALAAEQPPPPSLPAGLQQACWTADALRKGTAEAPATALPSLDKPLTVRGEVSPEVSPELVEGLVAGPVEPQAEDRIRVPGEERAASLPPLPIALRGSLRSVELGADLRLIALTFDLCEAARAPAGYDARIVNYLREEKVPATFYTGGKWMRSHPETTMQLLADPLFEIGNHSDTHESLRTLSLARLSEQILSPQAEYARLRATLLARSCATGFTRDAETALPALPATFRFPFGTCRPEALAAVAAAGMPAVQWNIVTGDPAASTSAAAITATVLAQARPGAIIVAHANGRGVHTAEALPRIIPELRRRGFRFVTVSELLRSGRPVLTDTCYELKPGDNAHYGRRSTRPHPP